MTVRAGGNIHSGGYFEGTGRIVLTASDAMQYSIEGTSVDGKAVRSVFTEVITEGLKTGAADRDFDGSISLDDLYDYALDPVQKRTGQKPMKWVFGAVGEIIIANNRQPVLNPAELPLRLINAISDQQLLSVRLAGVAEIGKLLHVRNRALSLGAKMQLKELLTDDSRSISDLAGRLLSENQDAQFSRPITMNASVGSQPAMSYAFSPKFEAIAQTEPYGVSAINLPTSAGAISAKQIDQQYVVSPQNKSDGGPPLILSTLVLVGFVLFILILELIAISRGDSAPMPTPTPTPVSRVNLPEYKTPHCAQMLGVCRDI
jgi:hypothetical protein